MNRMPRLSKSGIEYLDYVWNFYSGCENRGRGVCPVPNCWARGIVNRFKDHYPNGFDPMYYPEAFLSPLRLKKPSRIGMAFMGDLMGDWVDPEQQFYYEDGYNSLSNSLKQILYFAMRQCPRHTFLTLTKCHWNLDKWQPFPANCHVGVTVTCQDELYEASLSVRDIEASIIYVSIEPMYDFSLFHPEDLEAFDWVIIGAQTRPFRPPKLEEVREIVRACDKAEIPVFLKDNLIPILPPNTYKSPFHFGIHGIRQEMPE